MEDQTNLKISIPKPCHENWNKMTPNEKGAFCGKCAKTVIDFTKKSTEEIKNYFLSSTGTKTCGRFLNDQLSDPKDKISLNIPLHLLPRKLSFNKAFVFAVFIVFGTTLFSCSTQKGEIIGKIESHITDTVIEIDGLIESRIVGDTIVDNEKIKCMNQIKGDVAIEQVLGEVIMPLDTMKRNDSINEDFKTGKIKIQNK
ncbi:MAG: hypothetical protein K0S44_1932 [Bacteroidetes bacterium]|jgi:hypothetical protein|nr:hypothetical protein [Bacteroidota bacterium]